MFSTYRRGTLSLLLMALMVGTSFAVLASAPANAGNARADTSAASPGESTSWSIAQEKKSLLEPEMKLDSRLAEQIKESRGPFKVSVVISDRTSVNDQLATLGLSAIKGKEIAGLPTIRMMELYSKQVTALATNPGISRIMLYEKPMSDDISSSLALDNVAPEAIGPILEDYDVNVVHGAQAAWNDGWTGDGVKIAVIDDGFDMAHPDLQGQQARYEDFTSPYFGWPIVYEDFGALLWANEVVGGWIADTSAMVPAYGDYVYFDGSRYDVSDLKDVLGSPVKSASGLYRIGYHPDANLVDLWGNPVAVLVVDSVTPYLYDVVYVDVTYDMDFGNDKACTQGDEISYFDSYDPAVGVDNFSNWDAGDGYADYSGGMVYWISDGVNVLPGSDITYGATFTTDQGAAVAFVGAFYSGASHGTMTASAALASGETMSGQLGGMAPDAELICIPYTGEVSNSWVFAELGADGVPNGIDDANIVSNSYGYSDKAVEAGYDVYDMVATFLSLLGNHTLWFWSTGNGGPGYGTVHTVVDHTSVHVGAGTTMQYRTHLGTEYNLNYSKWGDVAPFSNSGPTRTGKLNAEIIASGMYSMEPAPLNQGDYYGSIGDGSTHFQLGSGTSHATPTAAGGMALAFQAWLDLNGPLPTIDLSKAILMAAADDMNNDPFKQGAGWLNAKTCTDIVAGQGVVGTFALASPLGNEPVFSKSALYPGTVYGERYELFPNFMRPGETDSSHILFTLNFNQTDVKNINMSSDYLKRTGSDTIRITTNTSGNEIVDVTGHVPASTQLLRITMFMSMSQFDANLDYESDVSYLLEVHDWVDLDGDGLVNVSGLELHRYTVDGSDCNYNQATIKDPIKRTNDGLILRARATNGAVGMNITFQLDFYEKATFPWIQFREWGTADPWSSWMNYSLLPTGSKAAEVLVSVPLDAPVGTYGASIYVNEETRLQCIPVVINVPAEDYEFDFGGPSYFDTPYNNNFTGIADKAWRFEVGDWRIYWCLPSIFPPTWNGDLLASVSWSELPTDVNLHILAPVPTDLTVFPVFDPPYGPGIWEYPAGSSDELYRGQGTFAVGTNTGGPTEVVRAPVGFFEWLTASFKGIPGPFAVLARCPVMSGNASSDMLKGYTRWVTVDQINPSSIYFDAAEPGNIPLVDNLRANYTVQLVSADVDVKGSGADVMTGKQWFDQPVWQDDIGGDFAEALANAQYTRPVDIGATSKLVVSISPVVDVPDLDLGLWMDENGDGVAQVYEQHWYVGIGGSDETLTLTDPEPGKYLVKVLGYTVTGTPGYFDLSVLWTIDDALITADGLEPTASSGTHGFNVSYSLPARAGVYSGAATFGFLGADDLYSLPVTINVIDVGKPVIQNLLPTDGAALNTNMPEISFDLDDTAEFYSGLDPGSVVITVNGAVAGDIIVTGDHVSSIPPFPIAEGYYTVEVVAADKFGNMADPATTHFIVNTRIEEFSARFLDPASGDEIADGTIVNLTAVDMTGWSDPNAEVMVVTQDESYVLTSDAYGYWVLTDVNLTEGVNSVRISTTNDAKVSSSMLKMIVRDTICMLVVDRADSPVAKAAVDVTGLTEPGATVTIGAVTATVSGDGRWTAHVTLTEGSNSLDVTATDLLGNSKTVSIAVVRDLTPPTVTIDSPADGTTVNVTSVTVSGTCELGAMVWVNGVLASSGGTTWNAVVALKVGANTLTVTAMDSLGNEATAQTRTITYTPPPYAMEDDVDDVNARVDDADAFSRMLMYLSIILFVVAVILIGVVWYVLNGRIGSGGKSGSYAPATEEVETPPSDVEREFEQLEREIGREDR